MKVKSGLAAVGAALLCGAAVLMAPPASADTTEFQEPLAESDPTFTKWLADGCVAPNYSDPQPTWHYRVLDLAIGTAGVYTYRDIGYFEYFDFAELPPNPDGYIDIEIGIYEYGTFDPSDPTAAGCIDTLDDEGTFTIPAPGTYTLVLTSNDQIPSETATGLGYWSISSAAATGGEAPPPWIQGYGRADADSECEAGWHPSYAMWPNGGTGGWTCERELAYNTGTGQWEFR